jgi:DNA-binding NtrC family response regulator
VDSSKPPIAVIVEDEASVRDVACVLFEESEMRAIPCDNAEKAFATLCQHGDETAVLFADVRLAGLMDGIDLAHRVKRMWPHVRIILTSGYASSKADLPDDVVYMPKPWLALDLLVQAERAAVDMQRRH